jgi:hypothetical protein
VRKLQIGSTEVMSQVTDVLSSDRGTVTCRYFRNSREIIHSTISQALKTLLEPTKKKSSAS